MSGASRAVRILAFALGVGAATSLSPVVGWAAPPEGGGAEAEREDAKELFVHGRELYTQGRYGEALEALEQSYRRQPSPNSEILIARCLRELGRFVEALERFQATETAARARVGQGEGKYLQTQEAAASEGAAVRARLGAVHLRLTGAAPGSVAEVDGKAVKPASDGTLIFMHVAGSAIVAVRSPSGAVVQRSIEVTAGGDANLTIEVPKEATKGTPPAPGAGASGGAGAGAEGAAGAKGGKSALPAGALVAGGVGLAGLALFAGFGLSARATYASLDGTCHDNCWAWSDAVASGKRAQVVANVSLGVGIAGLATATTFAALALSRRPPASASRGASPAALSTRLALGPTGIALIGAF